MHRRNSFVRFKGMLAAFVVGATLVVLAPASVSAATCVPWFGTQPSAVGGTNNQLNGVATLSPCDAWAIGVYFAGGEQSYIQRWDGTAWTLVPNPNPGSNPTVLNGVAAADASHAWAVGSYGDGSSVQTLIEQWDGKTWTQATSPNPGGPSNDDSLYGVAATSATNAWAVGRTGPGETLIERWRGTAWKRVPSPNVGASETPCEPSTPTQPRVPGRSGSTTRTPRHGHSSSVGAARRGAAWRVPTRAPTTTSVP